MANLIHNLFNYLVAINLLLTLFSNKTSQKFRFYHFAPRFDIQRQSKIKIRFVFIPLGPVFPSAQFSDVFFKLTKCISGRFQHDSLKVRRPQFFTKFVPQNVPQRHPQQKLEICFLSACRRWPQDKKWWLLDKK